MLRVTTLKLFSLSDDSRGKCGREKGRKEQSKCSFGKLTCGDVHDTTDRTVSVSDELQPGASEEEAAVTSRRPLERATGMTRGQSKRFQTNPATEWCWETLDLNACSSHHHHHHPPFEALCRSKEGICHVAVAVFGP